MAGHSDALAYSVRLGLEAFDFYFSASPRPS